MAEEAHSFVFSKILEGSLLAEVHAEETSPGTLAPDLHLAEEVKTLVLSLRRDRGFQRRIPWRFVHRLYRGLERHLGLSWKWIGYVSATPSDKHRGSVFRNGKVLCEAFVDLYSLFVRNWPPATCLA